MEQVVEITEGEVSKSTGECHSSPLQRSESLWSLSLFLGTSDKELEGSSEVSKPVQQLHFTEGETKAQRNVSMVIHQVSDRSGQGPICPVTCAGAHSTLPPVSEIFMRFELKAERSWG